MASTRSSTRQPKPHVQLTVSTEPKRKLRSTTGAKKHTTGSTTRARTGAGVQKQKKAPASHHKRQPHLSDKIGGAVEKAIGTVTHKPGKKAAGTRKMRGTDGKGSRTKRV
ncbi:hypothetical protein AAE478_001099 [Parahypoxylon ruwenzoriense]